MNNTDTADENAHIHIVLSKSEKGMIKKVVAGNNKKPIPVACLEVLNTLVEFGVDNEKLREILQKHDG